MTKQMAAGLLAGGLCQCELPDEEYFARRWEEMNQPEAVFEPSKSETADGGAKPQPPILALDETEFPPLPDLLPELVLEEGGTRLTPPAVGNRTAGLLPSIDVAMAVDRDFNVVDIPEWKPEQVKPVELPKAGDGEGSVVAMAKGAETAAMIVGLGASLPLPPLPAADLASPAVAGTVAAETGKGETDVAAVGVVAGEKVKVEGAAPGLVLTKPPAITELGKEWATGLAAGRAGAAKEGPAEKGEGDGGNGVVAMADERGVGAEGAKAAEETPEGVAVPGRAGLVKSPYGLSHQLVDVSDLKAGDLIKCPFSGKIFRVPKAALADESKSVGSP